MKIEDAFRILLTPDGKGKRKKAVALRELCDTCNANWVREKINEKLKDKKFV